MGNSKEEKVGMCFLVERLQTNFFLKSLYALLSLCLIGRSRLAKLA